MEVYGKVDLKKNLEVPVSFEHKTSVRLDLKNKFYTLENFGGLLEQ